MAFSPCNLDGHVCRQQVSTVEALQKLKPLNSEGVVTAGNASGINDGAACVMLASAEMVKACNLTPLARVVSYAQAGVEPSLMGMGPIPAVQMALKKANWNIQDLDLMEANEAFAAQAIHVNRQMGWDEEKVNVNGGAIALGHPLGCSGVRLSATLVHEMRRRGSKYGLATMCVGVGQGASVIFEGMV